MQVRVRDLMTVDPVSVPAGTTLQEAATRMIEAESAEIYVVDQQNRLLGVVPDYEILKHKLIHSDLDAPIDSLMNIQLDPLSPDDDALQLAHLFRERRNSCMAVTANGQLVGKLSCRDLFRTIMALESIEPQEEETPASTETNSTPPPLNPPHLTRFSSRKKLLELNSVHSD